MVKRFTREEFIAKASIIHNNLYDYADVVYTNMHTKVKILDPEYGEFWQTPMGHLNGQGHTSRGRKKSADKRKMSLNEFIDLAHKRHGRFYDYSKVKYIHCDAKVCIIDPVYGEFWQTPYNHLRNHGCPERTRNAEWLIHEDHIVPLSIICTQQRRTEWVKNRPLYKFLNSNVNIQKLPAVENRKKYDIIEIDGKEIIAGHIRNNYDVIKYVCLKKLNVDISTIVDEDRKYIIDTILDK